MPPHFRVIKLRHRPRHPTQIKAHAVLHRRHIQFFCHLDVYMHYLAGDVNFLFRWVSLHRRSPRFNTLGGHFPPASFLGERLRIVGSWTWPATKVPFWSYTPTTLWLPSHYSVITWRRRSESNRSIDLLNNPLLRYYCPATRGVQPHNLRTPIESGISERVSITRHYACNANQVLTNHSFNTRLLALPLALHPSHFIHRRK